MSESETAAIAARAAAARWGDVVRQLDEIGGAVIGPLLTANEATNLIGLYRDDRAFRSTVNMGQHRFGEGQYRYFADPSPDVVRELRHALYPLLLPIARDWYEKLGRELPWPEKLDEWLAMCHAAGQEKPTPLVLRYGTGDWNALHRDLYGELLFPLQVVINLTRPGRDHTGGEFLLVEQRPRAQSRGTSITLGHLEGFVFTTRDRPIRSQRGWSAAPVRHGVSMIRSGERFTLSILFHDAA